MGCKTVQSDRYVQTTGANLLPTVSGMIIYVDAREYFKLHISLIDHLLFYKNTNTEAKKKYRMAHVLT
jgi:hypothetical protein